MLVYPPLFRLSSRRNDEPARQKTNAILTARLQLPWSVASAAQKCLLECISCTRPAPLTAAGTAELATARRAAAANSIGKTASQATCFGLGLLGRETGGFGRHLRRRSRRLRPSVDAEVPKQQALQRMPSIASYCLLTRRERVRLVTLIDTASGTSISKWHDPKVVNLSVLYGCDRLAGLIRSALRERVHTE